ncbi:TonB-dependent receptor plug domain-containing protein (plasmid) [Sphingomonas carotinifaciens]|uniref:TonB-dependent receptor plug domain-containing protein n=1 Tax=Sphingomonas carotinifaciens TaxID=1166323 RepID=UPI00399F5853
MQPIRYLSAMAAALYATTSPLAAQVIDYPALEAVMGEPVTTSVTGKPQRASELPGSAIIITAEQIARSPARDVPSLLKSYAGIDVNRWTAGQSDVAVRGGVQTFNARLLVLVDGRQVYLDHYGMTNWNLLGVAIEDIQQIELVRGPASALFGFNAASGVVNIITRKTGKVSELRAVAAAGNHGMSRLAASLYLPVTETVGAKLTAGRLREDERRTPANILGRPRVDVEADHVSADVNADIGTVAAIVGGGYATTRQLEFLPTQLLSNQLYRSGNVHATISHDTAWGGLSLNGFVNWLDADYGTDGSIGGLTRGLSLANRTMVSRASALYRLGRDNTLRMGVEYRNNRLTSDAQYSDVISYNVASANVIADLRPAERVTVTAAARIDRLWLRQSGAISLPAVNDPADYNRAFNRVSLNAAILVRTSENGLLRINGGRGYQLPSLTNYGFRLEAPAPPPFRAIIAGSPMIDPVRTWSGELGYGHRFAAIRAEATAFYTHTAGTIASPVQAAPTRTELILTTQPMIVQRYYAAGDYATYGTEFSLSGREAMVSWRANYTWTRTREDLDDLGSLAPMPLSPQSTTPRHKANLELGYDDGSRWYATAVARYTSATRQFAFVPVAPLPQVASFAVDDAVAVDARLGLRLSRQVELFVAGENLTLAGGAAVSTIPADRRLRGGLRTSL